MYLTFRLFIYSSAKYWIKYSPMRLFVNSLSTNQFEMNSFFSQFKAIVYSIDRCWHIPPLKNINLINYNLLFYSLQLQLVHFLYCDASQLLNMPVEIDLLWLNWIELILMSTFYQSNKRNAVHQVHFVYCFIVIKNQIDTRPHCFEYRHTRTRTNTHFEIEKKK